MANDRYGDIKIAIEGEKAKWMYDVIVNSRIYKEFPNTLKLNYRENLLFIEESWCGYSEFAGIVLPLLLGDDYFYVQHLEHEDRCETNDNEGKYFKRGVFILNISLPELVQELEEKRITYDEYLCKCQEYIKDFYTLLPEEQIEYCMARKDRLIFTMYEIIEGEVKLTYYDEHHAKH